MMSNFLWYIITFGLMVEAVPGFAQQSITVETPADAIHQMVQVPEGEFLMGSDDDNSDEAPRHAVYLDAYYIDTFPVTNSQYVAFLQAIGKNAGEQGSHFLDLGDLDVQIQRVDSTFVLKSPELALRPVVEVTWYGARAYCEWAGLRLPTEAEWEKAARGTDGRTYPWGEGIDHNKANYGSDPGHTTDVGSYPEGVSPYGVYDMGGNVWNWVADLYSSDYYAHSPKRNSRGSGYSADRVMRGGGWNYDPGELRSSFRLGGYLSFTDGSVGFRCARDIK